MPKVTQRGRIKLFGSSVHLQKECSAAYDPVYENLKLHKSLAVSLSNSFELVIEEIPLCD